VASFHLLLPRKASKAVAVQKGKEQLFFLDTRQRRYAALDTAEQP